MKTLVRVGIDVSARELAVAMERGGDRKPPIVLTNDAEGHRKLIQLITKRGAQAQVVPESTGVKFYFATPHHAWERGTNENTNGLIRQYLPKRKSMAHVTQHDCNRIAKKLNTRPRKRYNYQTPEERFHAA